MADFAAIQSKLETRFPGKIVGARTETKDPWIEVAPDAIRDVCQYLKSDPDLQFDTLNDLCGADWLESDPKKKTPCSPHLEVVYHISSIVKRHRLKLKVSMPRWANDVKGQLPEVPSVADVWAVADWHEREAYDLVGVRFLGHPNLRRILCPEDWEGHPLRKDYEMPLEYHGMRGR